MAGQRWVLGGVLAVVAILILAALGLFLNLPDATAVMHSEEHLVVETLHADRFAVGDACYGVPWHICPTVALYGEAVVVDRHRAAGRWRVIARERALAV